MGVKSSFLVGFLVGCLTAFVIVEYFSLNVNVLHNLGIVKSNIGVYWDRECTNVTKTIYWGALTLGSSKSVIVFVENAVNSSAILTLVTRDWKPEIASSFLLLSWNHTGYIFPYSVVPVMLTLSVSNYVYGVSDFSFVIVITATWN